MTYDHFTELVKRVATDVKVTPIPQTFGDIRMPAPMSAGLSKGTGVYDVTGNPWALEDWTDERAMGAMAHEMGHIALGHLKRGKASNEASRIQEREADTFAVEHGYGAWLMHALESDREHIDTSDKTHDPLDKRLHDIEAAIKASKVVQHA